MSFLKLFFGRSKRKKQFKKGHFLYMQNTKTESTGLSQLQKLQALQAENKVQAIQSAMKSFDGLVVVNVGVSETEHFPKLKDENGKNLKDAKGADMRSKESDGYTYTFAEFGTARTIKIVFPKRLNLRLLGAYQVGGLGYDFKETKTVFIEKDATIKDY